MTHEDTLKALGADAFYTPEQLRCIGRGWLKHDCGRETYMEIADDVEIQIRTTAREMMARSLSSEIREWNRSRVSLADRLCRILYGVVE
jgi:hypothetical protein